MKKLLIVLMAMSFQKMIPAQNVGIGTSTPDKGKLVVRGSVGAVSAMFGDNTTGVAIENNYPGIGFNSYYNGGRKAIVNGYGGLIGMNPTNGDFHIYTSSSSGTADNFLNTYLRMIIKSTGYVGIGTSDPQSTLEVTGLTKMNPGFLSATAVEVTGRVKFSGPAFVVTASASNLTNSFGGYQYYNGIAIKIDNPYCNNNPNVMLMVTSKMEYPIPYSVKYDNGTGKWLIITDRDDWALDYLDGTRYYKNCANECTELDMPVFKHFTFKNGDSFNVLVIEN